MRGKIIKSIFAIAVIFFSGCKVDSPKTGTLNPVSRRDFHRESGGNAGGGTLPYYQIPGIIAHGSSSENTVVWRSNILDTDDFPQEAFITDHRFDLRIIARSAPSKGTKDDFGQICSQYPWGYKKLRMTVILRRQEDRSGIGVEHIFENLSINNENTSKFSFDVPSTSYPFILEIKDVKWDYDCNSYSEADKQSYLNGQPPGCPWALVRANQCFKIDLHFSTDGTRNLP